MGDSFLILIILAAVSVFLFIRLKGVLGTKTGHEKPVEPMFGRKGDAQPAPAPLDRAVPETIAANDPNADAFKAIQAIEPDFSPARFSDGARRAYEMLLMAFENGDKATLQKYVSPDVYQDFAVAIDRRADEGLTVDARFVGVRDAKITGARFDADEKIAEIDMRFVGELVTVVRDSEHRIVEGDPNEVRREVDTWTFGRQVGSSDPNWLLIATGE